LAGRNDLKTRTRRQETRLKKMEVGSTKVEIGEPRRKSEDGSVTPEQDQRERKSQEPRLKKVRSRKYEGRSGE